MSSNLHRGVKSLSSPASGGGPAEGRGGGVRKGEEVSRTRAKEFRKHLTNAETILWSRLRRYPRFKFRRQHSIGPYIADFACVSVRLIVEVDGETHSSDDQLQHDTVRDAFMRKRGWRIVRVWNNDVYKCLNTVLDKIDFEVRAPSGALCAPHPP